MASAGARAYNGGLGAEPSAGSRGRAPGQGWSRGLGRSPQKLKAFLFLDVSYSQYFAVFVEFSGDCITLPEIEITW